MNLATSFRDSPIKRKLMLIGLLTSGLALLSVSFILATRGWVEWRDRTISDMTTYADIIGSNAAPSILFDNRDAAAETLAALAANPEIVDAVIYDKDGKEFARFIHPRHPPESFNPTIKPGSYRFGIGQVAVTEPILFKGDVVGSIYLETDLRGFYAGILRDIKLTFFAALCVFLASIFMFLRMQKIIVGPILDLVSAMGKVSIEQNYGIKVAVHGKDEIGVLARTFNEMLEHIQQRDHDLAQHREHLEVVVAQRTAELSDANRSLEHELAERKQAEEKIRESEARYRGIFEFADDIIYLLAPDGTFNSLSPSFERLTGWHPDEWVGKPFAPIVHPDDLPHAIEVFQKVLSGQSTPSFELRIARKSGEYFDSELNIVPVSPGGEIAAIGIARDITMRKQVEKNIHDLNEELEAKVQERTQQLLAAQEELVRKEKLAVLGQVAGSVGHELRNPLGVMSNAVYFLQTVLADADDTTKEYLKIIKDEIAGSERIVSDLLDSVRTKPPQPEITGVAELIGQTLRKLTIPPSVSVKLDISETLPPLRVDAQQIHQVFRNLISNGIDAMTEGGVLEIRAVENKPDATVTVSVRDSGAGIAPEVLPKLFQPLFTTKPRGIGLGLVVVKNLTQANGGTVKVESEAGKGTVFTITLPAADETGVLI